ncbi:MAG: hypothetical protein E7366_03170 [Clostridiales bacterium]|nr:hypothetical protein [Clostridiales bacterium]
MKKWFSTLCFFLAFCAIPLVGCGEDIDNSQSQSQSDSLPPLGPPSTQSSTKDDLDDSSSFDGGDIDDSSGGGNVDVGGDSSNNSSGSGDIDDGTQVTLDFFSINDLHGKFDDTYDNMGVDEMTTYLRSFDSDTTVLLSAGDMWQGSAESNFTKGALITDWMNDLDFAAMSLGNHEFDWGESYIATNASAAEFPLLAINVYDKDTNKRVEYCDSSVLIEKSGVQIGIIGAIGDCYSSIAGSMVQDVYFKVGNELTSLVKAESQSLRAQGADVIIYVLHDDYNNYGAYDTSLSNGYVDLVFEGHSHQRVRAQDEYGVWHLQAGGDNYDGISRARVYVNTETNEVSVSTEIVSSYSYQSMQDDPIVDELLEKYESSLTKVNEVVGYNKSYRDYDDLGPLAAEATYHAGMKRWENSQYADKIVLGGGYLKARSPYYLPTKNVTYGDLYCLFPFDNDLVLCAIPGSRLKNQFMQTSNSAYHMYYSDYGKSLDPNSLSLTDTYYVIVDTYTSDYSFSGMGPMQIVEYYSQTEEYYNRDALADFAKAGGLDGGYNPNPSEKPDDSDTPITPTPTTYTDIRDIVSAGVAKTNITTRGEVIAVSKQSFLFGDNTGFMMFYTGSVPSVRVGDTVEVVGDSSVYSSNIQFNGSKNASYTVKDLDVSYTKTTPIEWGVNEVNNFNGKIGNYVKMTIKLYKTSTGYYNATLSAGATNSTISVINPADSVLNNITLSETPIEVVITGYPCYYSGSNNAFLNVLIDTISLTNNANVATMSALTTENSDFNTNAYVISGINDFVWEYDCYFTPISCKRY